MIIDNLVTWTIVSEVFLLLSCVIIFLKTSNPKKRVLLTVLFIIGGAPLLYLSIDHLINDYVDANIGLGFAFIYTWIYSIITCIIAITLLIMKKNHTDNKFT